MNVGSQITNWSFDAAIQDAYYLPAVNYTNYFEEGKVNISAHTNGICISQGLKFFYISHAQLIDMKFVTHKQLTTEHWAVYYLLNSPISLSNCQQISISLVFHIVLYHQSLCLA